MSTDSPSLSLGTVSEPGWIVPESVTCMACKSSIRCLTSRSTDERSEPKESAVLRPDSDPGVGGFFVDVRFCRCSAKASPVRGAELRGVFAGCSTGLLEP